MAASPIGFGASPSLARLDMVPIGGIIIWSGAVVDIPAGYQLCDGTNGTPDLEAKFVVGECGACPVGSTGGSETHVHVMTGISQSPDVSGVSLVNVGDTNSASSLPPYYSLAYIQRMS